MNIREEVLHKPFDELTAFQQRVVLELEELITKFDKLAAFLETDIFEALDDEMGKFLLREQLLAMSSYVHILGTRVGRF